MAKEVLDEIDDMKTEFNNLDNSLHTLNEGVIKLCVRMDNMKESLDTHKEIGLKVIDNVQTKVNQNAKDISWMKGALAVGGIFFSAALTVVGYFF